MSLALEELCDLVGGELCGDPSTVISDVAEIQNAKPGEIAFLGNDKYTKYISTTTAEALIVPHNFELSFKNLIKVENPNLAFAICIGKLRPELPAKPVGISKSASVSKNAILGNDIYIGPNVIVEDKAIIENEAYIHANSYIGHEARVGTKSIVYPNVTIYHECVIGENNIIHSGTVIGSDGFGFVRLRDKIEKIPQSGRVIIGNDVEIGANCSIDRGTVGDTVIGDGTKLDNQIQVGHNVKIGKLCFFAGQTAIAGSATIEDFVTVAGQVGIIGHITIGKGAIIAGKSGVSKDIGAGVWFGIPARPYRDKTREIADIRSLPDIKKRLIEIEKIVNKEEK